MRINFFVGFQLLAPLLFLSQIVRFQENKKILCQLISQYREKIVVCEKAGDNLCDGRCEEIWMCYTSLTIGTNYKKERILRGFCEEGVKKWGKKFKFINYL